MKVRFALPCLAALLALGQLPAYATNSPTMGFDEGNPDGVTCPDGGYLAGVAFMYNNFVTGLSPYCVAMADDGAWSGGARIYTELQMSKAGTEAQQMNYFCQRDGYLVSFKGFTQVYGVHGMIQITLTCVNLKNQEVYAFGVTYPTGVVGTEWAGGSCDDNSVATGVVGRTRGANIIQFGFSCAMTKPAITNAKLIQSPGEVSQRASDARRRVAPPRYGESTQTTAAARSAAGIEGSRVAIAQAPVAVSGAGMSSSLGVVAPPTAPPPSTAPLPAHFAPPIFEDGAHLWACDGSSQQACDGRTQALAWCSMHGFARLVASEPPRPAERGTGVVKNTAGAVCESRRCVVINVVDCAR